MLLSFLRGTKANPLTKERRAELKELCRRLGIKVKALFLLDRALTHSSWHRNGKRVKLNYERMEFLGDSVLNASASLILFKKCPDYPEGKLSAIRSSVVDEKTLSEIGSEYDLLSFVRFGNGERVSDRRAKQKITADIMESIIATLFLERGFDYAFSFVQRILVSHIDERLKTGTRDYKTRLQQYVVDKWRVYPNYSVVDEEGPDHNKIFTVEVCLPSGMKSSARGRSKKEAEQKSAEKILRKLNKIK